MIVEIKETNYSSQEKFDVFKMKEDICLNVDETGMEELLIRTSTSGICCVIDAVRFKEHQPKNEGIEESFVLN